MEGEHDDTVVETEDEIVEVENQDQEDAAPALETPGTDSADPVDDDGPEGQGRKTRKRIEGLLGDKAELRGHLDASQAENARLRQEIANKDTPAPTPEPKLTRPEPPTLEQFEGDFDRFTVAQNQFTQDLIAFDRQEADARAETKAAETARTNRENTRRAMPGVKGTAITMSWLSTETFRSVPRWAKRLKSRKTVVRFTTSWARIRTGHDAYP